MEVWKSSLILEHMLAQQQKRKAQNALRVFQRIYQERGIQGFWAGTAPRMVEGFFSGAVLLAGKETLRRSFMAAPVIRNTLSPAAIGFIAGAGGGAAQALVMAPTSMLVTAVTAHGGKSVLEAAKDAWAYKGLRGIYRGSSAVAARQATNWASRQGFTEMIRPRIRVKGIPGEIVAGCLGGAISCWNTPFEVCRVHSQSRIYISGKQRDEKGSDQEESAQLFATMRRVADQQGYKALFVGLGPRIAQACFQTVFLVCIPRLID